MTTRMLIDARHREETRVAVVTGNRIEEFDFESAERKQLKGNIYLAKVTRVEPSLQAAFIDYGGNRHGFLAFSEIHPDYYQIPKEDREALLREEAEHAAEEAALRAEEDADEEHGDLEVEDVDADPPHDAGHDDEAGDDAPREGTSKKPRGNDDQVEALRQRRQNLRRRYKIQDVIHRRQVLLVQVVKEERGNKGAALTTYLSLAGRYCVLMPNTSHGGGISRKISNAADRKRLKSIMADLALPSTMGCIVRTAGLQRTKVEIKRDFDYLARLWDEIREKTLASSAPALIHGDSDLIKRAVRDIYNRDVEEIIVEGEHGYRQARDFMKLLMPSHARRVKHYADAVPLFQRFHVEDQLAAMYHPVVQLKSGGYLVINPTEALVSIDINSGRSTREHNIEQTATATNLEAAHEIARQLRLRDMAGLVVIDFIDMDNGSNVRKVEKAMKEALKNDRARIQVGRISSFGLMEMSRQRLRTGVLEASTRQCPHCEGTGLVRTASSSGLSALRLIEDEAARGRGSILTLRASQEAALYVLNRKRADIAEIEARYGVTVEVLSDGEQEGARMSVEPSGPPPAFTPKFEALVEPDDEDLPEEIEDEIDEEEVEEEAADRPRERREGGGERSEGEGKKRRRRRGRRGRSRPEGEEAMPTEDGDTIEPGDADGEGDELPGEAVEITAASEPEADGEGEGGGRRRRGRRGRRGGRRGANEATGTGEDGGAELPTDEPSAEKLSTGDEPAEAAAPVADEVPAIVDTTDAPAAEPAPAPKRRRRKAAEVEVEVGAEAVVEPADAIAVTEGLSEDAPAKPKRTRKKATPAAIADDAPVATTDEAPAKPKRPRKKAAALSPGGTIEAANEATRPAADADAPVAAPEPVADAAPEDAPAPESANDAEAEPTPRRTGWWARTFGA